MDKLAQSVVPPSRIDLAREADFTIGALRIRPSRREVEGGGLRRILQRRVMQVLVALAHSSSEVVSQRELISRCWSGLSVSDDAIGRCIAQLRRLAAAWPQPPFEIKTVAGVGYRLEPAAGGQAAPLESTTTPRWRSPVLPAALSAVALAIGLLWQVRDRLPWAPTPDASRVAVLPFDTTGAGGAAFADALMDKLVGVLSRNQIQTLPRFESGELRLGRTDQQIERLGVGLVLDGAIADDGKTIGVRLHLDDAREHTVIWSEEFQGPAQSSEALQAEVAASAADVLYWAQVGLSPKERLDAASLAAFIAGRESTTMVRDASDAAALADYQKVVAAAPDFSWGHSAVAVSDAFLLLDKQAPPEVLRADTRREAERALALDPHNGEAYVALELAAPTLDWRSREALLLKGTAADPSFEPGALMEGRLQWFVGRGRAALPWLQRAHDINPLHDGASWTLAVSLASEGHARESRALVAQMRRDWPGNVSTKLAQFVVPVVLGDNDEALALLADPEARSPTADERAVDAWRATLRVMKDAHNASARQQADASVKAAAQAGSLDAGNALWLLTMLGDLDGAYAEAQRYDPSNPYAPPYLFLPTTARLRADARFMPLARKLGLLDYWRSTGQWPDFCFEPGLPYDCRSEAAG